MKAIYVLSNMIIALFSFWGSAYLLSQETYTLHGRSNPDSVTEFSGLSLYLLAASLFFLGAFAFAIARAWLNGSLHIPTSKQLKANPAYQGQVFIRFWYLVVPVFILLTAAFWLAG